MLFHNEYDWLVSWPVMLSCTVGYLLSIVVLKQIMQFYDKLQLAGFVQVYNTAQIVLCAYMVQGFWRSSFTFANPFGINSDFTSETEWFIFVHYLSKFLDFFDTWIMILKKNDRQLSFLHVYHHTSIVLIWGFLLQVNQGNGVAYFGAAINSLIHLMMYSHYLYTSFGYTNPFKKVVTQCQLIQFYLCITHAVLGVAFETKFQNSLGWLQLGYHITMILLFNDFFNKTYSAATGKGSSRKSDKHKEVTNGANGHAISDKTQ